MDSLAGAYLSGLPQLFGTFGGFPLPLASPLMDGDEVEIRWQLATYGQNAPDLKVAFTRQVTVNKQILFCKLGLRQSWHCVPTFVLLIS